MNVYDNINQMSINSNGITIIPIDRIEVSNDFSHLYFYTKNVILQGNTYSTDVFTPIFDAFLEANRPVKLKLDNTVTIMGQNYTFKGFCDIVLGVLPNYGNVVGPSINQDAVELYPLQDSAEYDATTDTTKHYLYYSIALS